MTTLRRAVYKDCVQLLDSKYRWIGSYHWHAPYPPFTMPADPVADIARALAWMPRVKADSKGVDLGDNTDAIRFRDHGQKVYAFNRNNVWEHGKGATDEEKALAAARWDMLTVSCYTCRLMMRALHYNEW